jgi:hypothetical protein
VAGEPAAAAERLLRALRLPPPAGVEITDVQIEAADLLAHLIDSPGVSERVLAALASPDTRAAALDAIALSAHRAAAPQLAAVVGANGYAKWSDRELVKLASALGSAGGPAARDAIAMMQSRGGWSDDVGRELALAARHAATVDEP